MQQATAALSVEVVSRIASACINARFCGFKTVLGDDGRWRKIPLKPNGQAGIGKTDSDFIPWNGSLPAGASHWGVVMQQPTYDTFGQFVLTVLDIDTKNSSAPEDVRLARLVGAAKKYGFLVEDSHSGKGKHIIFLAEPDDTLPPKVYVNEGQEVEIFGHSASHGKSVMLTGTNIVGNVIERSGVNVRDLLVEAGINPDAKPPKQEVERPVSHSRMPQSASDNMIRARDALRFITLQRGDYDHWTQIGMALQAEFGDAGFAIYDEWSSTQYDYEGTDALSRKWKSFDAGGGIGIGTLFHEAKEHGWHPPARAQIERTTAEQDFASFIERNVDLDTGEILPDKADEVAEELFWKPRDLGLGNPKGINYLLGGFLAESFAVISGQPGIGKTTAMVPLTLAAAGFDLGCMTTKEPRHIIYVSEDGDQVIRILEGITRFEDVDAKNVAEVFHLIDAKRVTAIDLVKLAQNVALWTIDGVKPWVVLDTASATMQLENENNNSEISGFVSMLKETIYTQMGASVAIITHQAKADGRGNEDATARGGSAWEGDATVTASLFMEGDERFLKLRKTRYEPDFREIKLSTRSEIIPVVDKFGEMQDLNLLWTIPVESDADVRKIERIEREKEVKSDRMKALIDEAHTGFLAYVRGFKNPVIRVGKGGSHVPPEGATLVSIGEYLDQSGIAGIRKTDTKRSVQTALLKMFGADKLQGFFPMTPKGTLE